jgi:hypothetical protein
MDTKTELPAYATDAPEARVPPRRRRVAHWIALTLLASLAVGHRYLLSAPAQRKEATPCKSGASQDPDAVWDTVRPCI